MFVADMSTATATTTQWSDQGATTISWQWKWQLELPTATSPSHSHSNCQQIQRHWWQYCCTIIVRFVADGGSWKVILGTYYFL